MGSKPVGTTYTEYIKENISSKVGKRSARQQYDRVKNIRIMPGTTFLKTEVRILYVLKVGSQTSKAPYGGNCWIREARKAGVTARFKSLFHLDIFTRE